MIPILSSGSGLVVVLADNATDAAPSVKEFAESKSFQFKLFVNDYYLYNGKAVCVGKHNTEDEHFKIEPCTYETTKRDDSSWKKLEAVAHTEFQVGVIMGIIMGIDTIIDDAGGLISHGFEVQ
jgi:hypothetical protein